VSIDLGRWCQTGRRRAPKRPTTWTRSLQGAEGVCPLLRSTALCDLSLLLSLSLSLTHRHTHTCPRACNHTCIHTHTSLSEYLCGYLCSPLPPLTVEGGGGWGGREREKARERERGRERKKEGDLGWRQAPHLRTETVQPRSRYWSFVFQDETRDSEPETQTPRAET